MEFNEPHSLKPSLQDQIKQLEQKIVLRRHLIERNTKRIKKNLHEHLLSPATMIAAAGLGLAFGLMLRHPSRLVSGIKKTTSQGKIDTIIAKTLKGVAVVRTLTSLLPKQSTNEANFHKLD